MNPTRIGAVVAKETREVIRDPVTIAVAVLLPLVMLFLFGYAISLDVDDVKLGVLDRDRSPASRSLVDRLAASETFQYVRDFGTHYEVAPALGRGDVTLALAVPAGYGSLLARGEEAPVQVLVDGTYSVTANLAAAYAEAAIEGQPDAGPEAIRVEPRVWYNPALKSVNYIVPGLFGVILMAFPPVLTALAIVREKETGSIQQIFASPLTAGEFLAGKLVPYGLIAFLQIAMIIAVGFFWFSVPLRGHLEVLLGAGLIYVFCTVGIGLLVSTVSRSQLVAMLLALIIALMPSFLFSGFLFPVFTMPYAMQLYARLFPAQYFIDLSRGVVLKGAGLPDLWPSVVLLAGYTLGVFALAVWRFRKKVA